MKPKTLKHLCMVGSHGSEFVQVPDVMTLGGEGREGRVRVRGWTTSEDCLDAHVSVDVCACVHHHSHTIMHL